MKLFLTGMLLFAACTAGAQVNRVSIGLNALSMRDLRTNIPNPNLVQTQRDVLFLPSVGYFRLLGKTTGIGIELGYNGAKLTERYNDPSAGFNYERGTEVEYQEYYISPSILETYRSKSGKYLFIGSVSLPVHYSPSTTSVSYARSGSGQGFYGETETAPSGSMLKLGLFLNGGIQRKLVGGLYLGLQAGLGGTYMRQVSKGTHLRERVIGTRVTQTETQVDNSGTELGIEIRPMISLNYCF